MKISDIQLGIISIPLKKPFKTALRTVDKINDVIVKIITDTGNIGYGEAPPTAVITGETIGSITAAINNHIKPSIIGMDISYLEEIMYKLHSCIYNNTSAKAAVDIAIYDLFGQLYKLPVYSLLGGRSKKLTTDITISVNSPEQMAKDSLEAVNNGYDTLKIKVGKDSSLDIQRIKEIRKAVGCTTTIRLDANQAWKPKEAISIIKKMEDSDLKLELVEQPVIKSDLEGLKYVTDSVSTPIMADESVFSAMDALKIMQMRAADLINIKLMKTGGLYNALKICSLAEIYGMECMIGCMLEGKISVTAAAHLANVKKIIAKIDLDGPNLCNEDLITGGAIFDDSKITLSGASGFGFICIKNFQQIN
ncbi:MAG: dipeptide epimerase [Bacillota bacterium]|nr:dipeptide epimerase [Bacillota bacterium]